MLIRTASVSQLAFYSLCDSYIALLAMGDAFEDDTTGATAALAPDDEPALCAVVSVDGVVTTHVLPELEELDIGRASSCDLVIEHPSISRRHATLTLSPLAITDRGSRNGTRLRGATLSPGATTVFAVGEAVTLGQATLLIQRSRVFEAGGLGRSSEALTRQLEV